MTSLVARARVYVCIYLYANSTPSALHSASVVCLSFRYGNFVPIHAVQNHQVVVPITIRYLREKCADVHTYLLHLYADVYYSSLYSYESGLDSLS